jgi:hypothetical protein
MMNQPEELSGAYEEDSGMGSLATGTTGMLVGLAVASGLAFVGGMLVGKQKGEARGLATGLELGRLEALATLPPSRGWGRFWQRGRAA